MGPLNVAYYFSMPRAEVVDEAMRKKYERELNAIEDELEKIYQVSR